MNLDPACRHNRYSKIPGFLYQLLLITISVCSSAVIYAQKASRSEGSIVINAEYPGGNIVVDSIKSDTVFIHQDLHDTWGNWFYWDFNVKNAQAGKTVVFQFTHPWKDIKFTNVIGVRGPAISHDNGTTWNWLGMETVNGNSFKYKFEKKNSQVRFGFGLSYTEAQFGRFIQSYRQHNNIEFNTLALTREGRKVERINIGKIKGEPVFRVLITARHHACEMMSSYIVEGMIEKILEDGETGRWFRENVEFLFIPFVDKDGVENGEQGKSRTGRDHNRDYSGESIYSSTRAIRSFVPVWGAEKLVATIDLHCPYIRGKEHEQVYLIESDVKEIAQEQQKFSVILEKISSRHPSPGIPYKASNNMKFGTGFNIPEKFQAGHSIAKWASGLKPVRFATTIEFPYANVSGTTVTQQNTREFGHTLAQSLYEYLQSLTTPSVAR
jgi:hypothetical protein